MLSKKNKRAFVIRTLLFRRTTEFKKDSEFDNWEEIQLVVSSCYVQLTFGMHSQILDLFNTIFIAPGSYRYKHRKEFFDGDVNQYTQTVNLSWPAVKKGLKDPYDALNLCLHEFAHCLMLENLHGVREIPFSEEQAWKSYREAAKDKLDIVRAKEQKVLRDYAGTNKMELFAVSVEAFFERPDYFASFAEEYYVSLARLLNQDPRDGENPVL